MCDAAGLVLALCVHSVVLAGLLLGAYRLGRSSVTQRHSVTVTASPMVTASQRHRGSPARGAVEPVTALRLGADRLTRRRELTKLRTRAYRARRRGTVAQPSVTGDASSSLSLREPIQDLEKEKKTREGDAGFDELWSLWPRKERWAAARDEFRLALRKIAIADLLPLARVYAETERPIKFCRQLGKWLHDEEWREQQTLRLASPLRAVTEAPRPAIDWRSHRDRFIATGEWSLDLGPPPGQSGCLMPTNLMYGDPLRQRIDQLRGVA